MPCSCYPQKFSRHGGYRSSWMPRDEQAVMWTNHENWSDGITHLRKVKTSPEHRNHVASAKTASLLCLRIRWLIVRSSPRPPDGHFPPQLRPCPHMESEVLSECLAMRHLHSSGSPQHTLNGKATRSPGLGQDVFTGTTAPPPPPPSMPLTCHSSLWVDFLSSKQWTRSPQIFVSCWS